MKNILVTGGCGFIASNFLNFVIQKYPSINFINIDNLYYCANVNNITQENRNKSNYKFIKGNICDTNLINYILIEASKEHDLDYIYIGLCDKDFNVKKWIDPEKSKAKFVKKLYLLGEILINEDLCEACSVRYIDDFDSHDLDDSYDYKKLLKVRENW